MIHVILAARYHGRGASGQAVYYLFRWLWHEIGWWAAPIYAAFAGLGIWAGLSRGQEQRVMSVEEIRAELDAEVGEPVITEGMTKAERRAEWDRHSARFQAQCQRLDEEHLLLGIGRSAAVSMTHELVFPWLNATSSRWYMALPERYMTPDKLARPDWDHSHYEHDEHGRIGRHVTTKQRPETQADRDAKELMDAIFADIAREEAEEAAS